MHFYCFYFGILYSSGQLPLLGYEHKSEMNGL